MGKRILLTVGAAVLVLSVPLLYAQHEQSQPGKQVAPAAAGAAAASWPRFTGPNYDNKSPDRGLLKSWPSGGPPLLWTYEGCGVGFSSVTIADGLIFTAGDFDKDEKVLALDMTGQLKWSVLNGKGWATPWPGSKSTPTYSDGMVYHLNCNGLLSAYEAKTGKQVWSYDLPREKMSQGGYAESVLIDGNNLICMPGSQNAFVVALNKKTGKTVWVSDFKMTGWDRASYVTGILTERQGRKHIIHASLFQLMSLDAATGRVEWSLHHQRDQSAHCDVIACSPLRASDDSVFLSIGYGAGSQLFRIDPSGQRASKVWRHQASDSEHAAAVLHEGLVYISGNYIYPLGGWAEKEARQGKLYCLDVATGAEKWAQDLCRCTLTYADGRVYALNEFAKVHLIEPSPEKCKIVGELTIPIKGRPPTLVHPVVIGGRMYIRHQNGLYVYDVKSQ